MSNTEIDFQEFHGFQGNENWALPELVSKNFKSNRPDQNSRMPSHEYVDTKEVLQKKIDLLVQLLLKSKWTTAYTGAGISRTSGIGDYATNKNKTIVKVEELDDPTLALPSYSHLVLSSLEKKGYLQDWVQQNHDGLPQKAGFPQEKLNEIHGAWFDPSNPVVQFSGSLRGDLCSWMFDIEKKTDLCLCLGTSLSGMNADRIAKSPCKRATSGKSIGTVIVNLQKTPLDKRCTLRIWSTIDEVFQGVSKRLNLEIIEKLYKFPFDKVLVPYDRIGGKLDSKQKNKKMLLDFSPGQELYIVNQHSCMKNRTIKIMEKREDGNYYVKIFSENNREVDESLLGCWWLESAEKGLLNDLPFVNKIQSFEK